VRLALLGDAAGVRATAWSASGRWRKMGYSGRADAARAAHGLYPRVRARSARSRRPDGRWRPAIGVGSRGGAAASEGGGFRATERPAARHQVTYGGSWAYRLSAELGMPVTASGWLRRAKYAGCRVAKMVDGHGGAAGGGGKRSGGVGRGWPRGYRCLEVAATPRPPGRRLVCRWEPLCSKRAPGRPVHAT
jgi:hypothetical protein